MSIRKSVAARAPYNHTTFNTNNDYVVGANGVLKGGATTTASSTVTIQPLTWIQQGLVVDSDQPLTVALPANIVAPYFVAVTSSSPVQNLAEVITPTFVKRPEDLTAATVLVAEWDGQEWRQLPYLSSNQIVAAMKKQSIAEQLVGISSGFEITKDSTNIYVGAGSAVAADGSPITKKVSTTLTKVAVDADALDRIDEVVLRKPTDDPTRVATLNYVVGPTFNTGGTVQLFTPKTISTAAGCGAPKIINSTTSDALYIFQGEGTTPSVTLKFLTATTATATPSAVGTLATGVDTFDAFLNQAGYLDIVYVKGTTLYYQRITTAGVSVYAEVAIYTGAAVLTNPKLTTITSDNTYFIHVVFEKQISAGHRQIGYVRLSSSNTVETTFQVLIDLNATLRNPSLAKDDGDSTFYVAFENNDTGAAYLRTYDASTVTASHPPTQVGATVTLQDDTYNITTSAQLASTGAYGPVVRRAANKETYVFWKHGVPTITTPSYSIAVDALTGVTPAPASGADTGPLTTVDWQGNNFTLGSTTALGKITIVGGHQVGTPTGSIYIDVYAASASAPTGAVLATSDPVLATSVTLNTSIDFTFVTAGFPSLSAGNYVFMARSTTTDVLNTVKLRSPGPPLGAFLDAVSSDNGGSTYTTVPYSFYYKIYSETGIVTPSSLKLAVYNANYINTFGHKAIAQDLYTGSESVDQFAVALDGLNVAHLLLREADLAGAVNLRLSDLVVSEVQQVLATTCTDVRTIFTSRGAIVHSYASSTPNAKMVKSTAGVITTLRDRYLPPTDVYFAHYRTSDGVMSVAGTAIEEDPSIRRLYEYGNLFAATGSVTWGGTSTHLLVINADLTIHGFNRRATYTIQANSITVPDGSLCYVSLPDTDVSANLTLHVTTFGAGTLDRYGRTTIPLFWSIAGVLYTKFAPFRLESGGETIIIGQALSTAERTWLGLPTTPDPTAHGYSSATVIAQGDDYNTALGKLDARSDTQKSIVNQNKTMRLISGGNWSYVNSTGVLTWSAQANIAIPGLADSVNVIAAGNVTLADGAVAFTTINRSGAGGTITVSAVAEASYTQADNSVIIARRVGSLVQVGINASTMILLDGELKSLGQGGYVTTSTQTVGAAITAFQWVYIALAADGRTTGSIYAADATNDNRVNMLGVAPVAVAAGSCLVVTDGIQTGLTSLVAGAIYYLDPSTPGAITATKPVTTGQWIVPVGVALSTTSIRINPAMALTASKIGAAATTYPNYFVASSADLDTAITGVTGLGGGVICLSSSFTISAAKSIPAGTLLIGRRGGTTITLSSSGSLTFGDDCSMEDVFITTALSSGTLVTCSANRCTFFGCKISVPITSTTVCINVTGNTNLIQRCTFTGVIFPSTGVGIQYSSGTDNRDENCIFTT